MADKGDLAGAGEVVNDEGPRAMVMTCPVLKWGGVSIGSAGRGYVDVDCAGGAAYVDTAGGGIYVDDAGSSDVDVAGPRLTSKDVVV